VSQSEIAFLALGLVLGTVLGAALLQALRSRPTPRHEVRLTIAPNSIPTLRPSTLATPGGMRVEGPARGSPDEAAWAGVPGQVRELVPAMAATAAIHPVRKPNPGVLTTIPATAVAIPITTAVQDSDPSLQGNGRALAPAVRSATILTAVGRGATPSGTALAERPAPAAVGPGDIPTTPSGAAGPGRAGPDDGAGTGTGGAVRADGACADERRLVGERCALAEASKDEARRAGDALRDAQRAYDILREQVERAQDLSDPRRVADAKERLHTAFRTASDAAKGPDETEAAARSWLGEINRLNTTVRESLRLVETGGADLRAQFPRLERLMLEADAARISAENAEAGCRAAREDLARCEEQVDAAAAAAAAAAAGPSLAEEPHPFDHVWPTLEPGFEPEAAEVEMPVDGVPAIIRILRGDRDARDQLVVALAGTDAEATRDWQLRVAHLVDAITARAIEEGFLDVAEEDPFWRLFSFRESRDIVAALSALGFRFDGLGGFADGRAPAARDLSLAVGYAGLDPMRIRTWPRENELAGLYAGARVAADEWLAGEAGDLLLGQMVDALGTRAGDLAEVWNAWGRVRPALLAT
jgi:hypothetical protein